MKIKKSIGAEEAVAERADIMSDLFAEVEAAADSKAKKSRKVRSKTGNVAATFERWIDESFLMSRALYWTFRNASAKRRSWSRDQPARLLSCRSA